MNRLFSVAPMLDWTDRHCRYFHRQLSRMTLLYTEMITTGALLHGDAERHLRFNDEEHPLAIQLGGSDPDELARASRLAEKAGFDEISLNVGCPSDRVQNGAFGACLMSNPGLVADCVKAMLDTTALPITVKHRTGIDERDSYAELVDFVGTVADVGCQTFIIHARKAWLQGLSPRENREIPPLNYDNVYQIKSDFPSLEIIINGGIQSLDEAKEHLQHVDGVMLGRSAYHSPWMLAEVDRCLFHQENPLSTRQDVIEKMVPYISAHLEEGGKVSHISRHMLGLFNNIPGARKWRRILSEKANSPDVQASLLWEAFDTLGAPVPERVATSQASE